MTHEVWTDFASQLSNSFSVFTPDLPGFGGSKLLPGTFSIEDVARKTNEWIEREKLTDAVLIGHSLGGYVTLSMIRQKPEWFRGFGLFHSTAYADSEEKKESRTKVLKFIDDNGVLAFTSNFIQPLFANPEHPAISFVKSISIKSEDAAVKGYTIAMRDRPDLTETIKNTLKPVLLIGGESDKAIPFETLEQQAKLNVHCTFRKLHNVAHMGMFERKDECVEIVRAFLLQIFSSGKPR
jgi:pimeloyl-ACP methyl ester carboxylesterase